MTVEVRALGSLCNLQCKYCYQHLERSVGNQKRYYNLNTIISVLEEINKPFSLFGGEALLMPSADLEKLWQWGFEKFGKNGIQTNGALISDRHIAMFKKYNVFVGLSIDGPCELNDARWAGSLDATRQATTRSLAAVERLLREGIPLGLIVVLHRGNAVREKLPALREWFRKLDALGMGSVRLSLLQDDDEETRKSFCLTAEENVEAFLSLYELERQLLNLKFDLFSEMQNLLQGNDESCTCIWSGCDPYTTSSVTGIEGDGQISICGRSDKDGLNVVKCDTPGFERYIALYQVPQEDGGCKGCRFFLVCKGHCPGAALNDDWRNRSRYCDVWKSLLEHMEARILENGERLIFNMADREKLEQAFLEAWSAGRNISISQELEKTKDACPSRLSSVSAQGQSRNDENAGN